MRPPARHRLGPVSALIACVSERAGERLVRPQSTLYNALLDPVSHAQSRASRKARGRAWRSGQGRGKRPNERTGDGARLRSDNIMYTYWILCEGTCELLAAEEFVESVDAQLNCQELCTESILHSEARVRPVVQAITHGGMR